MVAAQVFEQIQHGGHEGVYVAADSDTGLQAIIAVHDTTLGPALGGARFHPYQSFDAALDDALRLSSAMTYKAAAAGLPLGGGKAVIVGDPARHKSDGLLEAYGRAVDDLGGAYITAEDVGTDVDDMMVVRRMTQHVRGLPIEAGGSGDPSPATAYGVRMAMQSVAAHVWNAPDLSGCRVAVQGVGKVGSILVELLSDDGCELIVSDTAPGAADAVAARFGATVVAPEEVLTQPCDLLAPCALGGVLDASTIRALRCMAVVGAANNQLADDAAAMLLAEAGVLYAPDFVVNAGGIINIVEEMHPDGYDEERALVRVEQVGSAVTEVLETASRTGSTTLSAAEAVAEQRIEASRSGQVLVSR